MNLKSYTKGYQSIIFLNYSFFKFFNYEQNDLFMRSGRIGAGLASCSNDETVEMAKGDGISFRTVAGLNTRGAETVTDDLKTNGVWVTSFKEDGSIMYPETKYTESAGVWSAGQYWENETKLNFYLTYPEVKTWNAAKNFNLQNSKTITDFKVADAIKEQIDYVAAYVEANKTNAAIDADLQHILSQIVFKAKSSNKNYTYEISGVRIGKVNSTADYTFPTLTEKFGTFANLKDKKNYEYTFDAKTLNTATGEVSELTVADFGNAMLIPQTLTAWDGTKNGQDNTDQYFSIKVKLTKVGEQTPYYNGWAAVGVTGTWEAGKKYIYTLDLTNGIGKVDPDGPGPDQPNKPNQPGEDILGDPIKFDVSVEPWVAEDSDIKM